LYIILYHIYLNEFQIKKYYYYILENIWFLLKYNNHISYLYLIKKTWRLKKKKKKINNNKKLKKIKKKKW